MYKHLDQKITFYSSKTKSRKWTTIAFSYLLDICRINEASALAMNKHTEPRKQNLFEVGFKFCFEISKTFHPRQGLTQCFSTFFRLQHIFEIFQTSRHL